MLLYFCLTEKIPTAQVRDAKFEVGNVPPHLRPLLVRATDLEPGNRFASAKELKTAFIEVEEPTNTDTQLHDGSAPQSRKGLAIGASFAVACIIAALVAVIVLHPTSTVGSAENQEVSQNPSAEANIEPTGNDDAEREAASDMQTGALNVTASTLQQTSRRLSRG